MNEHEAFMDEPAIESLVRKVRGVTGVRVVKNSQGEIDEIHVVASPGRSAKQMVRDIESMLYVRSGIRLDHRKISLVQIEETALQPALVRVQLVRAVFVESASPQARVTLLFAGKQIEGEASSEGALGASPLWLVGAATARALDQLVGARGQLQLENIAFQELGAIQLCLAHLTLNTNDGLDVLLGVSVVRGDQADAVARSVLDAANRRLQRILSMASVGGA